MGLEGVGPVPRRPRVSSSLPGISIHLSWKMSGSLLWLNSLMLQAGFRSLARYFAQHNAHCQFEFEQVHQRFLREVSLQTLPMETLVMILEHLEWEDVLCVRRCSLTLATATRARSIWLNMFKRYATTCLPQPFHLPKLLQACSSEEIEEALTRWLSGIGEFSAQPVREYYLEMDDQATKPTKSLGPLPDGRFFLFRVPGGSLWYHDSQTKGTPPQPLIDTPFPTRERGELLGISVCYNTPSTLSSTDRFGPQAFNALMMAWERRPSDDFPRNCEFVFEVWRLEPRFSDQGLLEAYSSRRLASFKEHPNIASLKSTSLCGDHIAYVPGNGACVIVDWTTLPTTDSGKVAILRYKRNYVECYGNPSILLPGKRVAIFFRKKKRVDIYDWGRDSVCRNEPPVDIRSLALPVVAPIWSHGYCEGPKPYLGNTTPFLVGDSLRLVIPTSKAIFGMILHATYDPTNHPVRWITLFGGQVGDLRYPLKYFGYHRGVRADWTSCVLFEYPWPDEHGGGVATSTELIGDGFADAQNIMFDEYRKRIVNFDEYDLVYNVYTVGSH